MKRSRSFWHDIEKSAMEAFAELNFLNLYFIY